MSEDSEALQKYAEVVLGEDHHPSHFVPRVFAHLKISPSDPVLGVCALNYALILWQLTMTRLGLVHEVLREAEEEGVQYYEKAAEIAQGGARFHSIADLEDKHWKAWTRLKKELARPHALPRRVSHEEREAAE